MRFKIALIVTLILPLLTSCGAGSGGFTYPYDGAWTTNYNNPADWPADVANQTSACTFPTVTLNVVKGSGSVTQNLSCTITTTVTVGNVTTPVSSESWVIHYLISIAISEKGDTNAIVNGNPISGKCISTVGCAAQSTSSALSLTR